MLFEYPGDRPSCDLFFSNEMECERNNSLSGHLLEQLGQNSPLEWLDVSKNFFRV
jgi:hypothetical protein